MKLSALFAAIPFLLAACGGGSSDPAAITSSATAAVSPEPSAPAPAQAAAATDVAPTAAQSAAAQQTAAPVSTQPSTAQATPASSSPAQPAASASTSTNTNTNTASGPMLVEYYGDSIIWGWLPNNDWVRVDQPEPAVVGADTGVNVQNMGSPGRLAEHALAGDSVYPAWDQQMAQSKATHVIIEYHSHDTVADTTARVRKLIQIAKASGKKVIVETIGPGNHSGNLSWEQISQAQRDAATAENVPVIDQSAYLKDYLASTGKGVWDICADGLHPNPDIYVMKGHYAAKQFAALK
ncbi:MAG TPA: SGNH/GDSL hydrolase family protein [Noviherbaspirillum sp.]|nr:SGNH/GDSL hydrolase family protein [Noviherbaspirillum sp.]